MLGDTKRLSSAIRWACAPTVMFFFASGANAACVPNDPVSGDTVVCTDGATLNLDLTNDPETNTGNITVIFGTQSTPTSDLGAKSDTSGPVGLQGRDDDNEDFPNDPTIPPRINIEAVSGEPVGDNNGGVDLTIQGNYVVQSQGVSSPVVRVIADGLGARVTQRGVLESEGEGSDALSVLASRGARITNEGRLTALGVGARALRVAGNAIITNDGLIEAPNGVAIDTFGATSINNNGTIIGDIHISGDGSVVNNNTGGRIVLGEMRLAGSGSLNTEANSVLVLNNSRIVGNALTFNHDGFMAVTGANIISLGSGEYNGTGVISMQNGTAGDSLSLSAGAYLTAGVVRIDIDGQQQLTDTFSLQTNSVIDDAAGRSTEVDINFLTPAIGDQSFDVVSITSAGDIPADAFVLGDIIGSNIFDPLLTLNESGVYQFTFFGGIPDVGLAAGSMVSAMQNYLQSLEGIRENNHVRWRQRDAHSGFWVQPFVTSGKYAPGVNRQSFDFDQINAGVAFGFDWGVVRPSGTLLLGVNAVAGNIDTELTATRIESEADSYSIGGRAAWIGRRNLYADLSFRFAGFDADLDSKAARVANVSGGGYTLSLEAGYAFHPTSTTEIVPNVQWSLADVSLDDFSYDSVEYRWGDTTSNRLRLGVVLRRAFMQDRGFLRPYLALSLQQELGGDNEIIASDTSFKNDMGGTGLLFEAGSTGRWDNFSLYGNFSYLAGGATDSELGGRFGLRFHW